MYLYEKRGRYIIDFQDIPSARARMPEIPVVERKGNFKEVETGFPEEVAVVEAKRCLSCRRCLGCALCWAECKPEAINFDLADQDFELQVDKVILTSGLERKTMPAGNNFGKMHMNVVSDIQVERMLAKTGPSSGLILRPSDGEIPKRIGFVQTFEAKDEKVRDATLTLGINEAILAQKKIDGVEISFIAAGLDDLVESAVSELEYVSGISFITGAVVEAAEVGEKRDIQVIYTVRGADRAETFELVVLLSVPQLPSHIREAARQLGVEVDYVDFLGRAGETVETDNPGVVLAQNP